ncbi:hypothetical protein ANO14919_046290 [Xylariales sp. No.14919]|nr:hypothetical protein ANO14919_046290 [Xylariales sp. No.14919]
MRLTATDKKAIAQADPIDYGSLKASHTKAERETDLRKLEDDMLECFKINTIRPFGVYAPHITKGPMRKIAVLSFGWQISKWQENSHVFPTHHPQLARP